MQTISVSDAVASVARFAQRRPRTVIAAWLLFVMVCVGAGALSGTRTLTDTEAGVGQSARADRVLEAAGLRGPAVESVMVSSTSPGTTGSAVTDLTARALRLGAVTQVVGPRGDPALSTDGGRTVLARVTLTGSADDAVDHVGPVLDAVSAVKAAHPGVTVQEVGPGSETEAVDDLVDSGLHRAELISLPVTLLILVIAFGALVSASVPLILGISTVVAALGALGPVSHLVPNSPSTSAVVVLIGLAVGVDYSLFYIRREREERRGGRGPARIASVPQSDSALIAAAASVGRAIVVSGCAVVIALAGLLLTGQGDFISIGLGTILVVTIAVIGSLTVLPAVLALLGDRVDRGRVPLRRATPRRGVWAGVARTVTASPKAVLVVAVCALGALSVPLAGMHTGSSGLDDLPDNLPVVRAARAVEAAFPGTPDSSTLVIEGHDLGSARAQLEVLGQRAQTVVGGVDRPTVHVSRDGSVASVEVSMADRGDPSAGVRALRARVAPTAGRVAGVETPALVTGDAAASLDYSDRMATVTPLVIGFVLLLGFCFLLLTFRAPLLAAGVMALNLLSIGAAYGILTTVFQRTWAERLVGLHSSGHIVDWIPLFMFVVLFGLSMDYTILVLERIRERRAAGRTPRQAAAEGVAATAGTVTSAAMVMVAVFGIFATLGFSTFQQLGVGLAAAVALDATLVRGVALPALVAALGERGWRVPATADSSSRSTRRWEDATVVSQEAVR